MQSVPSLLWRLLSFFLALFLFAFPCFAADQMSSEDLEKLRKNLIEARELLKTWSASLSARDGELNEKEQSLTLIEQRLNEREAALRQIDADLSNRESSLHEREASLNERELILNENESDYQASVRLIAELKSSLETALISLEVATAQAAAIEVELAIWKSASLVAGALALIFSVMLFLK